MRIIIFALIGITIASAVLSNILVKAGTMEVGKLPENINAMPEFFFLALVNLKVIIGLALAFVTALSWMGTLSISDISFAYPFMSLTTVIVLILSGSLFGEIIPLNRWIGVFIVFIGIFIASRA